MRSLAGFCVFVSVAVIAPSGAFAADPYQYPADPPNFSDGSGGYGVPVVANWSGAYVGAQAGFGWGDVGGGNSDGGLVGGTLGINGQWGPVLFGAEADGSWSGIEGTLKNNTIQLDALGTIRGRVGYAFDRFVAYGTGGAAIGHVEKPTGHSDSGTYLGWTAGVGLEVALAGNFSAKLEYLYVDLGRHDLDFGRPVSVDLSANIVRAGINYRF